MFGGTSLQCEVCGRQIHGKPKKVIIEGAKMVVCAECAKLGSAYIEPEVRRIKPFIRSVKRTTVKRPVRTLKKRNKPKGISEELELVEDFGFRVRQARERLHLTHEILGRKIGEKVSVIKKIESGKMVPDQKLATKLEHMLKIKLLVPFTEHKVSTQISSPTYTGVTLGEIVQLKTGKRRQSQNEGDHSSSETSI